MASDHSKIRTYLNAEGIDFLGVATSDGPPMDQYVVTITTEHPERLSARTLLDRLQRGIGRIVDRSDVAVHVESVDMERTRKAAQSRVAADKEADRLKCSFCGKSQDQVTKLIAGPGVYICNECIDLCNEIVEEELAPSPVEPEKGVPPAMTAPANAPSPDLLKELTTAGENIRPMEEHIKRLVSTLRARDVTWAQIGEALGMTRQGAWGRFSGEE